MVRFFLLLVILSSTLNAAAASRATIKGKSSKEAEIRWAWKYLGEVVLSCASSNSDCQNPEIKGLVQKLTHYLPLWQNADRWQSLLQFVSEKEQPTFFQSAKGESHRLVTTLMKAESTLYINTDRMNLPVSQWLGILAHEATHHIGVDDDEKRLPDLVGSAISTHFVNQSHLTGYDDFGLPGSSLVLFNSLAPGRTGAGYSLLLINKPSYSFNLSDLELGATEIQKFCENNEESLGQETDEPKVSVTRIQFGIGTVWLRLTANTQAKCLSRSSQKISVRNYTFLLKLAVKFDDPLSPQQAWWNLRGTPDVSTIAAGHDQSIGYAMLASRAYVFMSTESLTEKIQAGAIWKTRTLLKSMEGHAPTSCGAFYSGANWAFQQKMDTPEFEPFKSCTLTSLGEDRWQVDAEVEMPANIQPDSYFIPLVMLKDSSGTRMVVPKKLNFTTLENPIAAPAMRAVAWQIQGLAKQTTYEGIKLGHGYSAEMDKEYFVDFEFTGSQDILFGKIEIQYLVNYSGQIIVAPQTLNSEKPTEALLRTEKLKSPRGTILRFVMKVPSSGLNFEVAGLQIVRAQIKTSDHAWAHADLPSDVFIFGPSLK